MNFYKNSEVEFLLDLGLQPISNRFISSSGEDMVPYYPIMLMLQKDTGYIYIENPFPIDELRPRYNWLTCYEPEDHLDELVEKIINLPGINKESIFGGYSFKDDSTLRRIKNQGYLNQWRIEPEYDLDVKDSCASIETYQANFNFTKVKKIIKRHGKVDVMIVRHVIEHAYDLQTFIESVKRLIKIGGYIVWELPDCEKALNKGDCTIIWEEHVSYFTSFTFKSLLHNSGFSIMHFECAPYPLENSIIAIVKLDKPDTRIVRHDMDSVALEIDRANLFARSIIKRREIIRSKLKTFRKKNGYIVLFGAGHLSVAFLSIMGIADLIEFVIDDNPYKNGMKMPVGNLDIVGSDSLYTKNISLCLLGINPHNQPKVVKKNYQFVENGGQFASIFIDSKYDLEKIL